MQGIVSRWAYKMKAYPHVSSQKSVLMACGPRGIEEQVARMSPVIQALVGQLPEVLSYTRLHKWLGLRWSSSLALLEALHCMIQCASNKFIGIASLCVAGVLPLCYVGALFEAVVDGTMRFGRWLLITAPGAEQLLDDTYNAWARTLLGACPWRSCARVVSELGWCVSGAGRGVIDLAMKRASLYALGQHDLYRVVFENAHIVSGDTFAKRGAALLARWGLADFIAWKGPDESLGAYKKYVTKEVTARCLEKWTQEVQKNRLPVNYITIRPNMSEDVQEGLTHELPWFSMQLQRSACRLRANLLTFGHLGGKRSAARRQRCVFCEEPHLSSTFHVLCRCTHWEELRRLFWITCGQDTPATQEEQTIFILSSAPGDPSYGVFLAWAGSLDRDTRAFWKGED